MTIKDQDKGKRVLVLIESPNKKKTESAIFKQLGYTKCIILASIGHITKIADDKDSFCNTGIYPDDGFKAKYVIDPDKKDTAKQIKDQVELADIVYVATDPDYEGSAIAYALVSQFKIKKYRRLYINAITKETISEAIEKSDYCKRRRRVQGADEAETGQAPGIQAQQDSQEQHNRQVCWQMPIGWAEAHRTARGGDTELQVGDLLRFGPRVREGQPAVQG